MRLDDNSVEALKEQEIAFREKFGREPEPDDPIFFDPDADTPQPIRKAHFEVSTVKAMKEAGIDPSVIYAFRNRGRSARAARDALRGWSSVASRGHPFSIGFG